MKIVSLQRDIIRSSVILLLIGLFPLTAGRADGRVNQDPEFSWRFEIAPFGIAPGQTARISVVQFSVLDGSVRRNEPIGDPVISIQLLDADGEVIAQSDEMSVPPGQVRFWDVPRESLAVPGERGTGRLQVQARILVETRLRDRHRLLLLPTLELIDNSTGKTEVLEGHQCLVFFLGGTN